jgi:Ni/Co efflux regulator RcnB
LGSWSGFWANTSGAVSLGLFAASDLHNPEQKWYSLLQYRNHFPTPSFFDFIMKTPLFATLAAAALLTATSAFAAPFQGPGRNDNYGYAKGHRVTPQEKTRWDAEHRNDNRNAYNDNRNEHNDNRNGDKFDRNKNYGFDRDHKVTKDERRHWEETHNYGYAQGHRITPQEKARWEASYRR